MAITYTAFYTSCQFYLLSPMSPINNVRHRTLTSASDHMIHWGRKTQITKIDFFKYLKMCTKFVLEKSSHVSRLQWQIRKHLISFFFLYIFNGSLYAFILKRNRYTTWIPVFPACTLTGALLCVQQGGRCTASSVCSSPNCCRGAAEQGINQEVFQTKLRW